MNDLENRIFDAMHKWDGHITNGSHWGFVRSIALCDTLSIQYARHSRARASLLCLIIVPVQ
jgi:hypothetical protein